MSLTPRRSISWPTNNVFVRSPWKPSHSVPSGGYIETNTRFPTIICPSYVYEVSIKVSSPIARYQNLWHEIVYGQQVLWLRIVLAKPSFCHSQCWSHTSHCPCVVIFRFQAHGKNKNSRKWKCCLARQIQQLFVYSRHKMPVMWRVISCYDLIMYKPNDE